VEGHLGTIGLTGNLATEEVGINFMHGDDFFPAFVDSVNEFKDDIIIATDFGGDGDDVTFLNSGRSVFDIVDGDTGVFGVFDAGGHHNDEG
jgi:hypothetical protein